MLNGCAFILRKWWFQRKHYWWSSEPFDDSDTASDDNNYGADDGNDADIDHDASCEIVNVFQNCELEEEHIGSNDVYGYDEFDSLILKKVKNFFIKSIENEYLMGTAMKMSIYWLLITCD